MGRRRPGYDRTVADPVGGPSISDLEVDRTIRQQQTGSLPELRHAAAAQLPAPADIRPREILGIPIAMTDYEQAMDVMDGMVARRERGYVCAVAVHAVMVAQRDP